MNEKQFNTGYVEIRTLEGDKFIKNLNTFDCIQTKDGYSNISSVERIRADFSEEVYNIYYDLEGEERVLARVSGYLINFYNSCKIRDLKKGDCILVIKKDGTHVTTVIKEIEKMEAVGSFFYNIQFSNDTFYADGVCLKNIR